LPGIINSSGAITIAAAENITVPVVPALVPIVPGVSGTIFGCVANPGVNLQLVPTHFNSAAPNIRFAQSDAFNNYVFSAVPNGDYYLTASAPGLVFWRRTFVTVAGQDLTDINIFPSLLGSSNQ
jgi:hypothetical protein